MAMPFNLLLSIRITNKQKVGLATVFGLATIIIIAAIIRAIEITTKARTDAPLLALMSIIESTVCKFLSISHSSYILGPFLTYSLLTIVLTHPPPQTPAVIVGCLPPFKTLFSVRHSTSNRYKSSIARSNSIPLNSQDDAYKVLARGGKRAHSDTESQQDMFRQDDTDMKLEEQKEEGGIIHVKRVFVSSFVNFSFSFSPA